MPLPGRVYCLVSSILAFESSGAGRHLITVPSGSHVRLTADQPDASGLIPVSFGERKLMLFLVDLEERSEAVAEQPA